MHCDQCHLPVSDGPVSLHPSPALSRTISWLRACVLKITRPNVRFVIDYPVLCFCVIKGASDVL